MAQSRRIDEAQMQELLRLARLHPEARGHSVELSQIRNAHLTNTYDQLAQALGRRLNMLEGDVRLDHARRPVMAHGRGDTGLPLDQWLTAARESGRQIKLEFKDSDAAWQTVALVRQMDIDPDLVTLNVMCVNWPGLDRMSVQDIGRLREQMPQSRIALSIGRVPYTDHSIEQARHAALAAGPVELVTFTLQADYITRDTIRKLAPYGSISAWNYPAFFDPADIEAERIRLREMGVNGMIDLRHEGSDYGPELGTARPQLGGLHEAAERGLDAADQWLDGLDM
jgi:hypothetical protein